ncbi:adenosylmethionine--8-amino-7-oxononanoate transaminase [bacterium]|jgi:adenosylmethionine---8-amino-7-oxononanoate aminotransferase|nr:adenosylmethionine--8-amino-7-oxononanoate transaminase [bacterium]
MAHLESVKNAIAHNWHPYTQMKTMESIPPKRIVKAEGLILTDSEGHWMYDSIASWWCNVHGHNHPKITEAITKQLQSFDHVMFGGFTHEPAITLSHRIVKYAPEGLNKVFYSDNGSTAVEVALKMAMQYWQHSGKPEKTQFICLENAYHGDTVGAMSVSNVSVFNDAFDPLMFSSIKVPVNDKSTLEKVLRDQGDQIAGMIIEPLVQGAGGMKMHSPEWVQTVRELCTQYNCLLIADEIAVGFGRTGTFFACDQAGITPDIMCISKGLTSGVMPLAMTLSTDKIYDAFYGEAKENKTFYHGHTFTANPIACATANACLTIFEEEQTMTKIQPVIKQLQRDSQRFADIPGIQNIRSCGLIMAMDVTHPDGTPISDPALLGQKVSQRALENHIILRPLGATYYVFLPLSTTEIELTDILGLAYETLSDILQHEL